jgi:UPF0755 protein
MRAVLGVSLALLLLSGTAVFVAARVYRAPGPLAQPADVVVPRGGLDEVGATLVSAGVVQSRLAFRLAVMATVFEGRLHAAELRFPAGASLAVVLDVLRAGRPVEHKVTIAEGLEAAQIAQAMARLGDLVRGEIVVPEEGAVLPETYVFERGSTAAGLESRMAASMRRVVAEEWAGRAPGLAVRSAREAVILASIVEHEARLSVERPMIARVFLNRLADGMRLQADPTAAYGAAGGLGALGRRLDRDDLAREDGYNTYVVSGLPAGPICSPGLASLRAVLHPASGDALYFVADGSGGHVFSASLAEHSANVARYRAREAR